MGLKAKKYTITPPLDDQQARNIDELFSDLYTNLINSIIGGNANNSSTFKEGDILYFNKSIVGNLAVSTTAGTFLRSTGTDPAWSATTLPNSATTGQLLYASGTNIYSNLTPGTSGYALVSGGAGVAPSYAILSPTGGGIGAVTPSIGGVLVGQTNALWFVRAAGSNLQMFQMGPSYPQWSTATYPSTSLLGDIIYAASDNAFAGLAKNTTATRYLANTGTSNAPNWDLVNLANGTTGTLVVGSGGTGATTLTANGVLIGAGTGAIGTTAVGATNTLLHGNTGAAPTYSAIVNADITNATIDLTTKVTGALPVGNGGTGAITLTANGVLLGNGTALVGATAVGATNTVLHGNTGAAPTYSAVNLAADVAATILPVANGGTNLSSGTSGGILGFTAAGTIASSVALAAGGLVVGGGAGATPTAIADVATGQVLTSGGIGLNPAYSATPQVSSIGLGVAAGAAGTLSMSGLVATYNNVATVGLGVPTIYGIDNRTGLTVVDAVATTLYTTTATNQIYRVSADIFATAAVTGTANYTIAWTENATAQTMVVSATALNVLGTQSNLIRPDNATTMTAQLTGTFTGTFTVVGLVERVA